MSTGRKRWIVPRGWAGMPRRTPPVASLAPVRVARIERLQRLLGDVDLRHHRISQGLSQLGLATLLGVRRTVVSAWEGGDWLPTTEHLDLLRQWIAATATPTLVAAGA